MKCRECAAENMEGADRCWECGSSFKSTPQKSSQGGWIIWSFLGAAGLAIVFMMLNAGSGGGGGSGVAASVPTTASAGATASAGTTGSPTTTSTIPPSAPSTGVPTP